MRNENFITIQGWMVNELELSGNDLICYAVIYGFSQDDNYWEGSQTYLSEWLGISRRTTIDVLNRLILYGYIDKQEYEVNKVKFCKYKAIIPNFTRCEESAQGGCEESAHCIYNIDNNKEERDKSLSKKDDIFEKCWEAYRRKGSKAKAKTYWNKLSEEEKQNVLKHIKAYVSARDIAYQKDFERYLRDKIFETVVVNGKDIVYDPSQGTESEYHPYGNLSLMFSEKYQCYIYIGYYDGTLIDGYTDDERPDGATVMLNSGRGTIVWSKAEKKWILKK